MKKFITYITILTTCLVLAGCTNNNVTESPSPSATPDPAMYPASEESTNELLGNTIPDSGYVFALTEEEKAVYEKLKTELTTDVFEGVDPISIAKINIQCGIDGEWEAEYTCFSQEGLGMTKKEWKDYNYVDITTIVLESRQSLANWEFPLIDDGEFVEDGNKGCIHYMRIASEEGLDEEDLKKEFHMLKNDKGIWEIRYMPHLMD